MLQTLEWCRRLEAELAESEASLWSAEIANEVSVRRNTELQQKNTELQDGQAKMQQQTRTYSQQANPTIGP